MFGVSAKSEDSGTFPPAMRRTLSCKTHKTRKSPNPEPLHLGSQAPSCDAGRTAKHRPGHGRTDNFFALFFARAVWFLGHLLGGFPTGRAPFLRISRCVSGSWGRFNFFGFQSQGARKEIDGPPQQYLYCSPARRTAPS